MDEIKALPTLGDTQEHAWTMEFLQRCFPESGGRVNADLNLAMAMCRTEPKCAQFAMQLIAQEIRSRSREDPGIDFLRFALGVLFMTYTGLAHAEGRCSENHLPPELEDPVRWNPEIIECANELGQFQFQ